MFLNAFPKTLYDIECAKYSNYQVVTNVLFRIGIIKNILNNVSSYYSYVITDADTPEILAEKVYKNPDAYWIILYANNIYDPNYDWPMNDRIFKKYITNKYGSISNSMVTIHHYEKVVSRTEEITGIVNTLRYQIDYDKLTDDELNVPHDYYLGLPETASYETVNMDGKTVIETISRAAVSNYDYEVEENEKRRTIKIIKNVFYPQIMDEFNRLTNNAINPKLRKLYV